MQKTGFVLLAAALTASACTTPMPESNPEAGVGFGNYGDYQQYRRSVDAELAREITTVQPPAQANANAPASNASPVVTANNPGISDEQDFSAVSERESIESDAARLAANREAFEQVVPEPVPTHNGNSVNIVEYALSTTNPVGAKVYSRNTLFAGNKFERNCAQYASPDLAQEAFLEAGGPQRDKLGIDPDGDGFACSWDPGPFRALRG